MRALCHLLVFIKVDIQLFTNNVVDIFILKHTKDEYGTVNRIHL